MLRAINLTTTRPLFYADRLAVIVTGETDPNEVRPLKAVWIEKHVTKRAAFKTLKQPAKEKELKQDQSRLDGTSKTDFDHGYRINGDI
jgi:hypothetical protein